MAFHLRKISVARTDFRLLCKIIILVFIITGSSEGKRQRWGRRREHLSHPCAKCDKRDCKEVTPETCSGIIQKDDCECCPVCVYQSAEQVPEENAEENQFVRPTGIPISNACKEIECPNNKICMINMQGLPMCRCPTVFWCKKEAKRQPLCGEDGKTYKSRCYLNVEECTTGSKIKVSARTTCAKAKKIDRTAEATLGNPSLKDERKRKKVRPGRLPVISDRKGSKNRGQSAPDRRRKDDDRKEKKKNKRQNNRERLDRKSRHKRRHQ